MARLGRRWGERLLLVVILTVVAADMAGAAPVMTDAVTLVVRPVYEGLFRPGSWMPILVGLENQGPDRTVEVRIGTREGAQYAASVELPHQSRKEVTVYVYLTPASRRLWVYALDAGRELATTTILFPLLNPQARFVAVVHDGDAPIGLPRRLANGSDLVTIPLRLSDLPDEALGLSPFDVILLDNAPTEVLSERQRTALTAWVQRGGQLVLGGGDGLQRTLAGLPPLLQPVRVAAVEPMAITVTLPGAAGETPELLPLARWEVVPDAAGRKPYRVPLPLGPDSGIGVVEQRVGRGRVTVLPWSPAHPVAGAWAEGTQAWDVLFQPLTVLPSGFAPATTTLDGFVEGNMAASLTNLPSLEFPPLGLLAGLVLVYIVLAGPVTYLVLRRLDRQALGWVVVPTLTVIFAALTYGVGYAQRGGEALIVTADLVEIFDEHAMRVRTFAGLFSPNRRSYTLQADTGGRPALLRPISVQGVWGPAPAEGGVFVQGPDPEAEVRAFEVAQWSMRAFMTDQILPAADLSAQIILDEAQVQGVVENRGTIPLRDMALVAPGRFVALLGDLAPGERRDAPLFQRQIRDPMLVGSNPPLSYLLYGDLLTRSEQQPLDQQVQRRIRILDAIFGYGLPLWQNEALLIAWTDAPSVVLTVAGVQADRHHTTLILARPRLVTASARVTLSQEWFATHLEGPRPADCFNERGLGVLLRRDPAVWRLSLPTDLYGLRPDVLTLMTPTDGAWPDDALVELYDWHTGAWEPQTGAQMAGGLRLERPDRFLASNGALRVRLSVAHESGVSGCTYVQARVEGTMP